MRKIRGQKGSVLITVMLFCILASVIVVVLLDKSVLLQKMHQNYLNETRSRIALEESISYREQILYQQFNFPKLKAIRYLQFVPDTLTFGETQGVDYYEITLEELDTTASASMSLRTVVAVRRG